MHLSKKIVMYVTIVSTILVSLLLILLLCKVNVFGGVNWSIIATLSCFAVGGFFAINSLNMISKNKIIGYVSLGLICLSVLLIIISTWFSIDSDVYSKFTWSLGLVSILFNIIVSSSLDLGKSQLVLQIVVYSFVLIADIVATLMIFGVLAISELLTLLLILIILSILGVIILKVIAKKNISDLHITDKNLVKISREEYNQLLDKAKKYDEIISKSKNESN